MPTSDSGDNSLGGPPPLVDEHKLAFPESDADQQKDGEEVEGEHRERVTSKPSNAY